MDGGVQGGAAADVEFRLLWPDDRDRTRRRVGPPVSGPTARMGQRQPESQKCSGAESIRPRGIPQRVDALRFRMIIEWRAMSHVAIDCRQSVRQAESSNTYHRGRIRQWLAVHRN